MSGLVRVQSFAMDGWRLNYLTWGPLVHRTFFHSSTKEMSMAMQQEPVHWRYLPLICLAYLSGLNFREYAHISRQKAGGFIPKPLPLQDHPTLW